MSEATEANLADALHAQNELLRKLVGESEKQLVDTDWIRERLGGCVKTDNAIKIYMHRRGYGVKGRTKTGLMIFARGEIEEAFDL